MLPKINRIKKKKDFDLIFKKGKNFKTSLLVLKLVENGLDFNRFGFIISKKVSKKAVVRNKIRRRVSEIIKNENIIFKKPSDFVLIIMPSLAEKNFFETKEAIKNILTKIKNV